MERQRPGERPNSLPQYKQIVNLLNLSPRFHYADSLEIQNRVGMIYESWLMPTEQELLKRGQAPDGSDPRLFGQKRLLKIAEEIINLDSLGKRSNDHMLDALDFVSDQEFKTPDGMPIETEKMVHIALLADVLDNQQGPEIPGHIKGGHMQTIERVKEWLDQKEWTIGRPAMDKLGIPTLGKKPVSPQ